MAVQVLQQDFTAGIRRHRSRDQLGASQGANVLWNATDWIIGRLGAPLRKRGAWAYQGGALASTPTYVRAICDGPFSSGHYLLAVEADGTVQRSADPFSSWAIDGTTVNVGALKQNPIFFSDVMVFPSPDGSATLNKATASTVATLATGTYKPQYITGHKGRVVGATGTTLIFGPSGSPTQAWDDLAAYGLSQPAKGIASAGQSLFVFYGAQIDRITGSKPAGYGVTADDIVREVSWAPDVGCVDAFSITEWNGFVIWADRQGVWMSEGSTAPQDLTWLGGAKDLFRDFMSVYDSSVHRVASGVYSDLLFVTMSNTSTHAAVDCLVCDLPRRVWYRVSNFPFTCYAHNVVSGNETWAGVETTVGRVAKLSTILTPGSSYKQDANGTNVQPSFETAYFRFSPTAQRITDVYLGYEMDTSGGDSTTYLQVDTATDPKPSPTFSNWADGSQKMYSTDMRGVTDQTNHWKRTPVRKLSAGLAIKVTQVGPATDTAIYGIGVESAVTIPGSRQM